MALFKGILAKEGKGVEKDQPQKSAFWLFLELYGRKFWKLMQVGLIHILLSIPAFIVVIFFAGLLSSNVSNIVQPILMSFLEDMAMVQAYVNIVDLLVRVFIAVLFMSFWGMGPATAGYTYILRNYVREDYAWPWSDFWENAKSNFFQAICVWIIDVIVFCLLVIAFFYYSTAAGPVNIIKYVIAFVFLAYTMMHFYIYQLMVTFKLKLKDIFKNSFLLAVAALPENALVFVISVVIHGIFPYMGLHFFGDSMGYWTVYILLALFILPGMSSFLMNFVANRNIKKYMLDRIENKDIKQNEKIKDLI